MTTDHSDNAIEDEALLADINRAERAARHWRDDARALRTTARSWRDFPVGNPSEAARFADLNEDKAARCSGFERDCLATMNGVLLAYGKVGDTWEINDSLYRVVTGGNPCVRLGSSLPVGEPDTDPEWSDRDEQAERMAHFAEMTRVGHP